MLLCIDIGNTNTVLATFAGDKLTHSWRMKTDGRSTADELGLLLRGMLASVGAQPEPGFGGGEHPPRGAVGAQPEPGFGGGEHPPRGAVGPEPGIEVTGVAACSTVPTALRSLRGMLARYYPHVPAVIVEPGTRTGVPMSIDNPKEAGADRVVNTLAAYTLFGGPSIVVDFGTSTNFDVVGRRGEYLGGVLTAGIEISVDALASRAAQLRRIELVKPPRAIGKNTVECLQSGVVYGFAGQVDGIVRRVTAELGGSVSAVVATGGLAPVVIDECETVTHHEPMLTLIGLRLVFERNA